MYQDVETSLDSRGKAFCLGIGSCFGRQNLATAKGCCSNDKVHSVNVPEPLDSSLLKHSEVFWGCLGAFWVRSELILRAFVARSRRVLGAFGVVFDLFWCSKRS